MLFIALIMSAASTQLPQARSVVTPSQLMRVIGGDADAPEFTFTRITDVKVAANGDIYVLDAGEHRVAVYDEQGRFRIAFGKGGHGPGEFVMPTTLNVDSEVVVFDPPQRRLSRFRLDGHHKETRQLPLISELSLTRIFRLPSKAVVGSTTARFSFGDSSHDENVAVVCISPSQTQVDTLLLYRSGALMFHATEGKAPWGVAESKMGEGGAWAVWDDSTVVLADGYSGRITWKSCGRKPVELRTVDLGLPIRSTAAEDVRDAETSVRAEYRSLPASLKIELPPKWSVARALIVDDQKTVWVHSGTTGTGAVWTRISQAGLLDRVELPRDFALKAVRQGLLVGAAQTKFGSPIVAVYKAPR